MANSKDKQKSVAKHLYMNGAPIVQIVELTGVSRQSVSRWLNTEGWKEERAAREMSKESITSRTLSKLGDAIDRADGDEKSIGRMADSLLKSVKAIKEINQSTTIVNKVDTLIEFENWMVAHRDEYPEMDDKMLVLINRMHSEFMGVKFKRK
uniref:Terminase ATPase subunit N-terminal domain-containing protein n=1 Tax=Myoviridae sp. ctgpD8 TaxID=2825149 RepID=A0A8S5QGU5_9CAUD|nr:MAG TPA: Protein of unknown function (DUF1804) [Myoviridae sp. ctgpD8]